MENIEKTMEKESIDRDNGNKVDDVLINEPDNILDKRYLLMTKRPTSLHISLTKGLEYSQ